MSKSKRGSDGRRRRRKQNRPLKKSILVVCEGKTEELYFDFVKRQNEIGKRFSLTVKQAKSGSHLSLADSALKEKSKLSEDRDFDAFWVVMDVEDEHHRESLQEAIRLLKQNHFEIALSNPCFEVWYLAHFVKTDKTFLNCNHVITELKTHWRKEFKSDYDKTRKNNAEQTWKKVDIAIEHARSIKENQFSEADCVSQCNSSTEVYKILMLLCRENNPSKKT